jgi:hypothetical protein
MRPAQERVVWKRHVGDRALLQSNHLEATAIDEPSTARSAAIQWGHSVGDREWLTCRTFLPIFKLRRLVQDDRFTKTGSGQT